MDRSLDHLPAVLWASTSVDRLDEDGRPVGEVGSRLYDRARTEIVACPYADARRGHPMNRSALRQVGACWPEVVVAARHLAGPAPTVHAASAAALTASAIPHAWPDGAPIPRVVSVLYKASLGMSQVTAALLLAEDGVADAPFASLGDDEAFFRYLDDGRWLVGRDQACAGPEALIRELYRAVATVEERAPRPEILAEVDLEAVRAIALEVAGLQAVTLLGVSSCLGRGVLDGLEGSIAEDWLAGRCPAWMRSVLAAPGRRPEHVRRLFTAGGTPAAVEGVLASAPATPAAWVRAAAPGASTPP